jgi:aminoglycoside/choline kinase family phosphotransferase
MDVAPGAATGVGRFAHVARHLAGLGLSVPDILAEDPANGFLLLEDFGDSLLARAPAPEAEMYAAAADVLVALHAHAAPDWLATYDVGLIVERASFVLDWYTPEAKPDMRMEFAEILRCAVSDVPALNSVITLRDYHAENLIWLPDRSGLRRIGLLDFQDAEAGHPAYDLVSLLADARRDVDPAVARLALDRYLIATGRPRDEFLQAAATVSAQRNLRILGVFARLCLSHGKPGYVDLMPRVWRNLMTDLNHPALESLRRWVIRHVPEPTPSLQEEFKSRCATIPAV